MASTSKDQLPLLSPAGTPAPFQQHYQQLLSGINRIRYIKKKQARNQLMINEHLSQYMKQFQKQQQLQQPNSHNHHLKKSQSQPSPFNSNFKYDIKQRSPYRTNSQQVTTKINNYRINNKPYQQQAEGKENSYQFQPTEASNHNMTSIITEQVKGEGKREKEKLLLKKKQENCQLMRQRRAKIEERQKQMYQEKLKQARDRKLKALGQRQIGRKRIEEQYFQHIQSIKAEKEAERIKKAKIAQQKIKELLKIRQKQEQELARYEQSIILQEQIKSFLQQASYHDTSKGGLLTDETTMI